MDLTPELIRCLTNISASFNTVTIKAIIPIDQRILVLIASLIFSSMFFSKVSNLELTLTSSNLNSAFNP